MKTTVTRVIRTLKTTYNGFPAGTLVSAWQPRREHGATVYECYASYNQRGETYVGVVPAALLV